MAVVVCGSVLMLLGGGSIANVHKRCCIAHCQLRVSHECLFRQLDVFVSQSVNVVGAGKLSLIVVGYSL